jgi:DNA ligase-1
MKRFTDLYWRLDATTSTNDKVAALRDYFAAAPPDDAACALAVLSGARQLRSVSTSQLRGWAAEATGLPAWLIEECYAHVGDLAETLALLLPDAAPDAALGTDLGLAEMMQRTIHDLRATTDDHKREVVADVWRRLAPRERIVWHKLLTGGCRVGVSRTLVARALAEVAGIDPAEMAHRLMGGAAADGPAYLRLLASESTEADSRRPYPFFLAAALDRTTVEHVAEDLGAVGDWQSEWKWDGMRAQLVRRGEAASVWSRGEELVNEAFPEIAAAGGSLPPGTVLDGELLAVSDTTLLPFAMLSKRASRKTVTKKILTEIPCVFVAYDLLEQQGEDLRPRPIVERRARLEALVATPFTDVIAGPARADANRLFLSPLVTAATWEELAAARADAL